MDKDAENSAQTGALARTRVAIIGLGLMGGSLALALQDRCAALLGVDPDPETRELALERGIVEQISPDPHKILPQADLVVLAAPVNAILQLLADLPDLHPSAAVVLDLGSTKARIVDAMQRLPTRFDPLGGHPMCGKEKSGLRHAEATLFQDAAFALTPLTRTSPRAQALATELVAVVGGKPVWLDPATHDRWTARTSHFPFLAACLLAAVTPEEAAPLAGPGFRSTTRLAATSPAMMLDILMTNQDELLAALADFRHGLDQLEQHLALADSTKLLQMLERGRMRRSELLREEGVQS